MTQGDGGRSRQRSASTSCPAVGESYVSVEPCRLFRLLGEQSIRFNNRLPMSGDRFCYLVRKIVGKRLTYAELPGKIRDGCKEPKPYEKRRGRGERKI
jgi:hypothetical protein